jgi:diaminohydroxyphosphoribosylaminopyrimidine deaminase/5-amino-6-(5-phosphoribosylamino)uracil reductase
MQVLAERDINSVMIEGGAETLNAFIREGLWDEARIFHSQTALQTGVSAPEAPGQLSEFINIGDNVLERRVPGHLKL